MSDNNERYYKVKESVLFDDELKRQDLKVFLVIMAKVQEAAKEGKEFAPENISFASELKLHPRSLQRALESLEKKGYILREQKNGKRYIHV